MKRENFITLILGTICGILFAFGMCMCLITEWNAFNQGVIMGLIGIAVLVCMVIVRRRTQGKPPIKLSKRVIGIALSSIASALIFGLGMCMTMVWSEMMLTGIIVGTVGIMMCIGLIPLIKGIK